MNDWDWFFVPAVKEFLKGNSPYSISGFYNPPWLVFLLTPLVWASPLVAMAFPAIALVLAAHHRRKPWIILIVGSSFPFIAATAYANVDWIPLLGVAYGGMLGPLFVTVKPQAAGMTIVPLLRRFGLYSFLPLAAAVAVSFLLWPSWPGDVLAGDALSATGRNLSLFPYSIPLGVVALGLAWRSGSLLWGCVASLSFAPYFYVHSTLPLLFLMADRKWWLGVLGTLGSWLFVFLALQGVLTVNF